jgi:hypothetical protein
VAGFGAVAPPAGSTRPAPVGGTAGRVTGRAEPTGAAVGAGGAAGASMNGSTGIE